MLIIIPDSIAPRSVGRSEKNSIFGDSSGICQNHVKQQELGKFYTYRKWASKQYQEARQEAEPEQAAD